MKKVLFFALPLLLIALWLNDRGISETDPTTSQWLVDTVSVSKTLNVNGHHVRVLDQGKGTPIVLLHGWCDSSFTWRHVIPPLAEHYRVIALDWPGFGYSSKPAEAVPFSEMADVLAATLDELGIEQAVIAGNSMGGGASLQFAATYPKRVIALIPIDAAVPMDINRSGWVIKLLSVDAINDLAAQALGRFVHRLALKSAVHQASVVTDQEAEERYLPLNTSGARSFMIRQLIEIKSEPVPWKRITSISAPTLIVWGKQDHWIPLAAGESLQKNIPNSSMVVLDRVGHMPQLESPKKLVSLIKDFVGKTLAPASPHATP